MERKIGETFEFEGKNLQVKENVCHSCDGCFLDGKCTRDNMSITGHCESFERDDNTEVIFVEVQEQPKLNLCETLKYCPQGEMFWSPMLGDVKFHGIDQMKRVCVTAMGNINRNINADGTITIGGVTSPEIMLYPSKEQRDWTKVKYEPKKELPRTWEGFCKNYPRKKGEAYYDIDSQICFFMQDSEYRDKHEDKNMLPNKQAAEAHLALMQLHQLRDAWREGWLPDWNNDNQGKYAITKLRSEYEVYEYKVSSFFLSFQDEKRADEFKDCFIDLIEKAGDLI